jgi:uncharacterized membrane protein YqhA
MKTVLGASRYLILLAVVAGFASAVTLLVFGAYETGLGIFHILEGDIPKSIAVTFIEIADLLLLGVVLYIIALGLYELFIDDSIPVPEWLQIHTLDDLKAKLISVVIVVLGVLFLKQVVAWDGQRNLLTFGGGIALIIAALTYFLSYKSGKKNDSPNK